MRARIRTAWFQIAVLFAGLALALFCFWIVRTIAQARSQDAFEVLVEQGHAVLISRLSAYDRSMNGLSGLFLASNRVTAKDFTRYAASLDLNGNLHGTRGIGHIAPLPPAETGPNRFTVKYFWPPEGDGAWEGRDLAQLHDAGDTLLRARDSGRTLLVPQVLLPETGGPPVSLIVRPLYSGVVPGTDEGRRAASAGWVFAVVDPRAALQSLLSPQSHLVNLTVALEKDSAPVYLSAPPPAWASDSIYRRAHTLSAFGHDLSLRWSSTPYFESQQPFRAPWIVLALGLIVTGLMSAVINVVARRERTITAMVAQKSREIETRQKEYRSIVENALVAILSADRQGSILSANQSAIQLLSLEDAAPRGNVLALIPGLTLDGADGRSKLTLPCGTILEIEKNFWTAAEDEPRITLLIRDITQLERQSAEIADTERRWNLALMGAETGVFDLDLRNGRSIVSDMWRKIMHLPGGAEDPDPYGRLSGIVHPADRSALMAARDACCRGDSPRAVARFRIEDASGSSRWIRSDAVVVERAEDGTALRMLGTQTDITEQVRLERMKDNFVATVSHELRTPLTSIKGALGLLNAQTAAALPEKSRRLVDIALANSERLANLVNDILDIEKIDAGSLTLDPKAESVHGLLQTAADINAHYASASKASIAVDFPVEDSLVWVDPDRTIQVLSNLLSNACKFCFDGTTVRVGALRLGGFVRISVANQGPGIPEDFRARIFQPFSQADNTDTRQKGGTGLGLSISQKLVEHMGGTIGFDSEPGGETVFWFTCPVADSSVVPLASSKTA